MEEEKTVEQTTEKTVEETTKENEKTETSETKEETSTEEKTEVKTEEVDYKAELEIAKKTISKQEGIIDHKEDVIKAEKEKNKEVEETVEPDDEPDKFVEFEKKQKQEMDDFKFNQTKDKIDDEINKLAKSEDEAELIQFHLKNSVKINDYSLKSVQSAVKSAWLIANEKKILNTNTELANSLKAKSAMTTTANTSSESIKDTSEELSGEEKKLVDKFTKKGEDITASATR